MSVPINSATTNYFDFSVGYNYYTRQVTINDTSSYKPGGAAAVSPISYVITSPSGITSSGTITPSAPVALVKSMGLIGSGIEYGTYTVTGTFTDSDAATYTLPKATILCPPQQCTTPPSGANGCVSLSWTVKCIDNYIIVADTTTFSLTVNNIAYTGSATYGITVINPNATVIANNVNVPYMKFTPVVNGAYWISADDIAVYTIGDGVTVTVHYILPKTQYKAQCDINLCEVQCAVDSLYQQWKAISGTGSPLEQTLWKKLERLSILIPLTQIAISCGGDTSAYLLEIEELSGVNCSCSCGTSGVNQGAGVDPDQTIILQSGGGDITVDQTTVGLTTTWTIADLSYVVAIDGGSSAYLSVTSATVGDTKTYTLSFTAGAFNNIIDNTTVAVANTTTAAETLLSQAIAANTLAANEAEIQWETMYEMVSATDKLTRVLNVTINGETLFTKTISGASAMANVAIVKGKIIRPSNTTAYAYTTVEYYNLNEFVTKEINIAPTSLAGTWNWTTTGYTILVRTTQATVNVIKANYLNVEVFRPV